MSQKAGGPVDKNLIGTPLPRQRVVVERSAVQRFASAVCDDNAVYFDTGVARRAGFDAIPAPPTFAFVMGSWGAFRELQPQPAATKDPAVAALQELRAEVGGMILHGEQEFIYHRPVEVGDELASDGRIIDVYQRESGVQLMTFCVSEVVWTDDRDAPVVTTRSTLIHRRKKSPAGAPAPARG